MSYKLCLTIISYLCTFLLDLKKLIKYERKQKELDRENIRPHPGFFQCNSYPVTSTRSAPIESSIAKQNIKKDNIISVAIRKKSAPSCYNYQIPCNSISECAPVSNLAHKVKIGNNKNISLAPEVPKHSTESSLTTDMTSPKRPKSCDTKYSKPSKSRVTFRGNSLKPKASCKHYCIYS